MADDELEESTGDFGKRPEGCVGGICLMQASSSPSLFSLKLVLMRSRLQKQVEYPDIFESHTLSVPKRQYETLLEPAESLTEIIYRKSDVKRSDVRKSRNWELVLSHEMETGVTRGVFKGTKRSNIAKCIAYLKSCPDQIDHPLFLPILIFTYDMGIEKRHRENRERVRVLEKEVAEASQKYNDRDITKADSVDLARMNNELVSVLPQG